MFEEVVSLTAISGFLAEVLKALVSDKAKEWTKRREPETRGKRAAFELYQTLERLDFHMQEFVTALKAVIAAAEVPDSADREWRYFATCQDLHDSLKSVLTELRIIDNAIRWHLSPALSIHRPGIVQAITKLTIDRSQRLPLPDPLETTVESEQWKREFTEVTTEAVPSLRARLTVALENQLQIRATIDEFRQLLANEFTFKESFI